MRKVTYPKNEDQAQALAQFLVNEWFRHRGDMLAIKQDLFTLMHEWGVRVPAPTHEFMRANKVSH
jgi:1,2-phenylacetyl-CoA epoxidase catalytic subunit